ncbi:TPA: hypothetical protein ACWCGT_005446, partial [Escherichia coli]
VSVYHQDSLRISKGSQSSPFSNPYLSNIFPGVIGADNVGVKFVFNFCIEIAVKKVNKMHGIVLLPGLCRA